MFRRVCPRTRPRPAFLALAFLTASAARTVATPSVANVRVERVGVSYTVSYTLGADALSGSCSIYSSGSGTLVRVFPFATLSRGPNSTVWDGRTTSGAYAGPGQYYAEVSATGPAVPTLTELTAPQNQSGLPLNSFQKLEGRNYWQIASNIYPQAAGREAFHNLTYFPTVDDDGSTKFAGVNVFGPDGPNAARVPSPAGVYGAGNTWPISTWGGALVLPDGRVLLGPRGLPSSAFPDAGTLNVLDPLNNSFAVFPRNGTKMLSVRQMAAYPAGAGVRLYAADDGSYGNAASTAGIIFADFTSGVAPASVTTVLRGGNVIGSQTRNAPVRGLVMNRAEDTMWVVVWGNNSFVNAEVLKFIKTGAGTPGTWEEADGVRKKAGSITAEPAFTYPAWLKQLGYQSFVCLSPDERTLWVANNDILTSTTRFVPNRCSVEGLDPVTGASRGAAYTVTGLSYGPQKVCQEGSFNPSTGDYSNGNLHVASYGFVTGTTATRHSVLAPPDGAVSDTTRSLPFTIGAPVRLAYISQPAVARAKTPFVVQPTVTALDAAGNAVLGWSGTVSLSLLGGAPGATLYGQTSVASSDGVAGFADVGVSLQGSGYVLRAASAGFATADSAPFDVLAPVQGNWGDVDEDGLVTGVDATLTQTYIASPSFLTAAQRERIRRYGDIAGTVNRTTTGNGVVDGQDVARSVLLASGLSDAGTTGPYASDYGDVQGDAKVSIVDAVTVNRRRAGLLPAPVVLARVDARGGGDISPTVPYVTFGDGAITSTDVSLILARAQGTEAGPPAYADYWPLHSATPDYPATPADLYTFTDVNGFTGDLLHRINFATQAPREVRGYTVTDVLGSDGSVVGVVKGVDGSLLALSFKYPYTFGDALVEFTTPLKILDAGAAAGTVASWNGVAYTTAGALGVRPVAFTGRVLTRGGVYYPSAGAYPTGDPPSRWSGTVRVRLDIAILAGPTSQQEMQQAFFFDFTPGIGMVGRGQASLTGSPAPTDDRVRLEQSTARVRARNYSLTQPAP